MKNQVRTAHIREADGDGRNFTAVAVRYNVLDDFNTMFAPGCLAESLQERLPQITWAHKWDEVIGRVTSYEDTSEELIIHARLSDPDAVPRARQAIAQIRDGEIEDVSVGFAIESEKDTKEENGIVTFLRATLNEVACVLRGAVPGAKVLTVRSAPGCVIEAETAGQILAQLQAGTLTLKDALQAVEDASIERPTTEPEAETEADAPDQAEEEQPEETPVEVPQSEDVEAEPALNDAELDEVLADVDAMLAEVKH